MRDDPCKDGNGGGNAAAIAEETDGNGKYVGVEVWRVVVCVRVKLRMMTKF